MQNKSQSAATRKNKWTKKNKLWSLRVAMEKARVERAESSASAVPARAAV